ncbi:hypothetical protein FALBO_13062 [Fusarium albosuccineum]|uniref:Uncharacterized protein n=1 Tax=Fusarium albosuccineum TaxID=1237068 RepID=A0A8H4KZA0_9HYPO|nr:hypothetical protein FALBO_13062 [Fusarium albosuccineum]
MLGGQVPAGAVGSARPEWSPRLGSAVRESAQDEQTGWEGLEPVSSLRPRVGVDDVAVVAVGAELAADGLAVADEALVDELADEAVVGVVVDGSAAGIVAGRAVVEAAEAVVLVVDAETVGVGALAVAEDSELILDAAAVAVEDNADGSLGKPAGLLAESGEHAAAAHIGLAGHDYSTDSAVDVHSAAEGGVESEDAADGARGRGLAGHSQVAAGEKSPKQVLEPEKLDAERTVDRLLSWRRLCEQRAVVIVDWQPVAASAMEKPSRFDLHGPEAVGRTRDAKLHINKSGLGTYLNALSSSICPARRPAEGVSGPRRGASRLKEFNQGLKAPELYERMPHSFPSTPQPACSLG